MVMDTLRGTFDASDINDDAVDFDLGEEEAGRDLPPAAIGQDERRMQVRAYNHWASTLGDRNFPSIEVLEPEKLDDFGPYSVLLDFSQGIEDPLVQFLGDEIAAECGTDDDIENEGRIRVVLQCRARVGDGLDGVIVGMKSGGREFLAVARRPDAEDIELRAARLCVLARSDQRFTKDLERPAAIV